MIAHTTRDPEGYPMAAAEEWTRTSVGPTTAPREKSPLINDRIIDAEISLKHLHDTIGECELRLAPVLTPDLAGTAADHPPAPTPQLSQLYHRTADLAAGILEASNRLVSLLRRVEL
jgi:hypothetical protein